VVELIGVSVLIVGAVQRALEIEERQ